MKKFIFLFLLFISVLSFAKENFTENEKNILLKQFVNFQKAVKNKDINSLKQYINDPVYGFNHIDGKSYDDFDIPVSYNEVVRYKARFFEDLKEMALLKVDLNSNSVKNYTKGDLEVSAMFSTEESNESWGLEPGEKYFMVYFYYDDPEYPGYNRFIFKTENNKLKLHSLYVGP